MLHDKNIESLVRQLSAIGIQDAEGSLRKQICLHPPSFQVTREYRKGGDVMYTLFYFERRNDMYECMYYEAVLRREIPVPEVVVNEVNVPDLDGKMNKMQWSDDPSYTDESGWQREEAVEAIITALQQLSSSAEGTALAELLRFRHWCHTPLQYLVTHAGKLKKRYEIGQRFYFYADESPITIEEAYRFLCHRWREKQMRVRKRLPVVVLAKSANEKGNGRQTVRNKPIQCEEATYT